MYEKIKTFQEQINHKKENLLYSVINSEEIIKIENKISKFLNYNEQKDYNVIIEHPSIISKTDEQIIEEFENSMESLKSCSIS